MGTRVDDGGDGGSDDGDDDYSLDDVWTDVQLRELQQAEINVPPLTANFWGAVAERVSGKDAVQCHSKWFEQVFLPLPSTSSDETFLDS